ncbi:uncharacterized protein LOC133833140 [Humulus lupulus]|uniref:uncharacterized protein LOC133833140 n=1 Tax=Humulus lupulus TaxID=3486 RepID=UPI002B41213E|nr:uncharacterized protein LOC133833140 [Humulus lupulus]
MEEIRSAAEAYYEKSNEGKQQAEELYQWLDTKQNGFIGFKVYGEKLYNLKKKLNNKGVTDPIFFSLLDKNDDGFLDKQDVITLSYLINNGKLLFCESCGAFLIGQYFSCVKCFASTTDGSFYKLCSRCYHRDMFDHHADHTQFTADLSLLMKTRHHRAATNPSLLKDPFKLISISLATYHLVSITGATMGTGAAVAGTGVGVAAGSGVAAWDLGSASDSTSVATEAADPSSFTDILSTVFENVLNFL